MKLHAAILGGCLFFGGTAVVAETAASATLADLAWLAGDWWLERNGRVVEEHWLPPAGGTMLGMSRTVKEGRTLEYEFMVLRADDAGVLHFHASPSGQAGAAFRLVRVEGRKFVFENPANDFPQRVIYGLQPDGSLLAAIEGERDGKVRRIEFPYRRRE